MIGLIGKKLGMTQVFDDNGHVVPVTVIEAGPCDIVQVKTLEKEGYNALQIGFGERRERLTNKPLRGHFTKTDVSPKVKLREFRIESDDILNQYKEEKQLTVELFKSGERVDVDGISKGKGFQGVIKRHNFNRGPKTHGSHSYRRPGSIGASADPSRVVKGKKMPGRMGNRRVTIKNLEVVRVDKNRNILFVRGAVPGPINGYVTITKRK